MLFDRGDAFKRVINFLRQANDVVDFTCQNLEVATDRSELCADVFNFLSHDLEYLLADDVTNIIFGGAPSFVSMYSLMKLTVSRISLVFSSIDRQQTIL